jgi:hypothetical protein
MTNNIQRSIQGRVEIQKLFFCRSQLDAGSRTADCLFTPSLHSAAMTKCEASLQASPEPVNKQPKSKLSSTLLKGTRPWGGPHFTT